VTANLLYLFTAAPSEFALPSPFSKNENEKNFRTNISPTRFFPNSCPRFLSSSVPRTLQEGSISVPKGFSKAEMDEEGHERGGEEQGGGGSTSCVEFKSLEKAGVGKKDSSQRWGVLREAVFAASREKLFEGFPKLEIGLFQKIVGHEGRISFAGWTEAMEQQLPPEIRKRPFRAVEVSEIPGVKVMDEKEREKVDVTGVLNIFPSEEVLAAFMLLNEELFTDGKNMIEIGAGYHGLAGLLFAKNASSTNFRLCLSDGSATCVGMLQEHIVRNNLQDYVASKLLLWDRNEMYEGAEKYDVIVISDSLFLNKLHPDLLNAIVRLLKDSDSRCYIISPPRSLSLGLFMKRARLKLDVQVCDESLYFLEKIQSEQTQNFHPSLLVLRRISS